MKRIIVGGLMVAAITVATALNLFKSPPPVPVIVAEDSDGDHIAFDLVAKWEGLRLSAYRDIVGVLTVCYGRTRDVAPGDSYSAAECRAMLVAELAEYRAGLHLYFSPDTIERRLPRPRDAAFTSLAYNAGVAAIGKSTAVRRLNGGDIAGACTALTWWNRAGDRVVRGLVRRRADEYALCMRGVGT